MILEAFGDSRLDITITAGSTEVLELTVTDADNNAVNIAGSSITLAAKYRFDDASKALDYSTTGGEIVITDASSGVYQITFAGADLAALVFPDDANGLLRVPNVAELVYTLYRTPSGGDPVVDAEGKLIVREGVD